MLNPGVRVREFREMRGMTQEELAFAANMRSQYLDEIESGKLWKVHTLTYRKLADALNVTLEMIMGEEEIAPKNRNLIDEVPIEYQFVVRWTLRLTFLFGSLLLLFGVVVVFSSLLFWSINLIMR